MPLGLIFNPDIIVSGEDRMWQMWQMGSCINDI
jgi:hypothetical protein